MKAQDFHGLSDGALQYHLCPEKKDKIAATLSLSLASRERTRTRSVKARLPGTGCKDQKPRLISGLIMIGEVLTTAEHILAAQSSTY